MTLQGKLLWWFMNENSSLHWRAINVEFDTMDRGWFTRDLSRLYGNEMWKKLCKGRGEFQNCWALVTGLVCGMMNGWMVVHLNSSSPGSMLSHNLRRLQLRIPSLVLQEMVSGSWMS